MYYCKETGLYEGIEYAFRVVQSNRTGDSVEVTGGGGDRVYRVAAQQVDYAIRQLESGVNPDELVQHLYLCTNSAAKGSTTICMPSAKATPTYGQ